MPYSNLSRTSLLSLTLLIFSAGIIEAVNPYPTKAVGTRDTDASFSSVALLTAQVTPQVTPSPVSPELGNREGGDGTLWWLLFLCLGLPFLLAWLGSKKGATLGKPSTLILTPETGQTARIYWEIPPAKIQGLRRRGGKNLAIRLTDVTNINPQVTTPKLVQQIDCSLSNPLISLQVPESDREYAAELGCITNDGNWVSLARSAPAYFPAPPTFPGGLGRGAGIVTAIGSTAIGSTAISSFDSPGGNLGVSGVPEVSEILQPEDEAIANSSPQAVVDSPGVEAIAEDLAEETNNPILSVVPTVDDGGSNLDWGASGGVAAAGVVPLQKDEITVDIPLPRINLLPSDETTIKANWVLPESIKATYQSQGGRKLALRIYDVTGIDPELPLTGTFKQFAIEETGLATPLTLEDLPNNQYPQTNDLPSFGLDGELSYGDYQGELGYLTETKEWLGVAKSNRVRLSLARETQIYLNVHAPGRGYVYWEIASRDDQDIESQDIESQDPRNLMLRLHDATGIDIDSVPAHSTQEYRCDPGQQSYYLDLLIGDRPYADYIAELGYITPTGNWLRIIRSLHARFFNS